MESVGSFLSLRWGANPHLLDVTQEQRHALAMRYVEDEELDRSTGG